MTLTGRSIIASAPVDGTALGAKGFTAVNPASGEAFGPDYISASPEDLERATAAAEQAFAEYRNFSGTRKAMFLRDIAQRIEANRDAVVERTHLETALPVARLQGELTRTANQLRLFADVVEEGSWVMARIDRALPARTPLPRPDIRSMLRPLGPVAVFGASNFPLAFSVAGGDTASALAAGNPVIVKAHPAHPGTSELVGQAIASSAREAGLPSGVFSLLFDKGTEIGVALVRHACVKAVGFTGSLAGGRALMDAAAARPDPIPCFAEMSSANPVFILPGALSDGGEQIAKELFSSITLGAGQFCTKPGLVFVPQQKARGFADQLQQFAQNAPAFTMLTLGIAAQFSKNIAERRACEKIAAVSSPRSEVRSAFTTHATILMTEADFLESNPAFCEEVFGPAVLIVSCSDRDQILRAAKSLNGHLTATLLGSEDDLRSHRDLVNILESKVGRVIFNGYPTGVEVCHAMVHGGPYPASSDGRFTSVGSQAIFRFARPVCYQNFPEEILPAELQNENPLQLLRMIDGTMSRESISP